MFDIELAKLPPPNPDSAATASMTGNGVCGFETQNPSAIVGMSSRLAEMIVQLRPPNLGTMKVYGNRSVAPTRLGIEISQKICEVSNAKPAFGSCTTTMLQSCQTMKPRNSAKIDQPRLRRAIEAPAAAHWVAFSGCQPSIHRPARWTSGASGASPSAVVEVLRGAVVVIGSPCGECGMSSARRT